MLSVRLNPDIEVRLTALAKQTGRTKSWYVKKALEQSIEDMEDLYLAQHRVETLGETISLEEMEKRLGLDN